MSKSNKRKVRNEDGDEVNKNVKPQVRVKTIKSELSTNSPPSSPLSSPLSAPSPLIVRASLRGPKSLPYDQATVTGVVTTFLQALFAYYHYLRISRPYSENTKNRTQIEEDPILKIFDRSRYTAQTSALMGITNEEKEDPSPEIQLAYLVDRIGDDPTSVGKRRIKRNMSILLNKENAIKLIVEDEKNKETDKNTNNDQETITSKKFFTPRYFLEDVNRIMINEILPMCQISGSGSRSTLTSTSNSNSANDNNGEFKYVNFQVSDFDSLFHHRLEAHVSVEHWTLNQYEDIIWRHLWPRLCACDFASRGFTSYFNEYDKKIKNLSIASTSPMSSTPLIASFALCLLGMGMDNAKSDKMEHPFEGLTRKGAEHMIAINEMAWRDMICATMQLVMGFCVPQWDYSVTHLNDDMRDIMGIQDPWFFQRSVKAYREKYHCCFVTSPDTSVNVSSE